MAGILDRIKNKRPAVYTDFDAEFEPNPITGDLKIISDEKAVAQALKFLVLTNMGERLFQPRLGGDIYKELFKNNTPAAMTALKERVKDIVTNYEKRVDLIDVDVVSNGHSIGITVFYSLRTREETLQTTIFLERDR